MLGPSLMVSPSSWPTTTDRVVLPTCGFFLGTDPSRQTFFITQPHRHMACNLTNLRPLTAGSPFSTCFYLFYLNWAAIDQISVLKRVKSTRLVTSNPFNQPALA